VFIDKIEINEYLRDESIIKPVYSSENKTSILKFIETDAIVDDYIVGNNLFFYRIVFPKMLTKTYKYPE